MCSGRSCDDVGHFTYIYMQQLDGTLFLATKRYIIIIIIIIIIKTILN